jgi:3-deoxy-7-phosphoheptulonate synthase
MSIATRIGSSSKLNALDDTRVSEIKPLIPPEYLMEEVPLTATAFATVSKARKEAAEIIAGVDDRLLVIVGPCSVHDPQAAIEYGKLFE